MASMENPMEMDLDDLTVRYVWGSQTACYPLTPKSRYSFCCIAFCVLVDADIVCSGCGLKPPLLLSADVEYIWRCCFVEHRKSPLV